MSVYKRGKYYSFDFVRDKKRYQRSTSQSNERAAIDIEADFRTHLVKGEKGLNERVAAPTLKEFSQRFIDHIETRLARKPKTVEFYAQQLARQLDYEPLASARMDAIGEALVENFVQHRSQQEIRNRSKRAQKPKTPPLRRRLVCAATVNRALATLRKLLRLAHEWRLIDRVPRVHLLQGERNREFILSHAQEQTYLKTASQPLRDFAMFDLDTGLRVGEALALEWSDVHLEPANKAKFGYIRVRDGKSRFAKRNVPLTERVREMLASRKSKSESLHVFVDDGGKPLLNTSLDHQHANLRKALKFSGEFVLHSLRHTYGTRLGEAGADAFTIMRLMGHSSVTVSQRYVHPTPEALEMAVERLEGLNQRANDKLNGQVGSSPKLLTSELDVTESTTVSNP